MKYLISCYDEKLNRHVFLTKLKGNEIYWSDLPNQGIKFDTAENAKDFVLENYKIFKWTHHEKLTVEGFENNFLKNLEKEIFENDEERKN